MTRLGARNVARLGSSALVRQVVTFAGAGVAASGLALVSTTIVARSLSPEDFGAFAFGVSFLTFMSIFFGFGVYPAAARMAALAPREERAAIVGTSLVLYIPVGIAFSLVTFGLSSLVDGWFAMETSHGAALGLAALVGFAYPFQLAAENLARGIDRLHVAALGYALFQAVFVVALVLVLVTDNLTVGSGLVVRSLALAVAAVVIVVWLRPAYGHAKRLVRAVLAETRRFGFQVYLGLLLSIGSYNMDVLMVGVWAPVEDVGYYALAASLAGVTGLPVIALANALFVRMAHGARVEPSWIVASAGSGAVLALIALALATPAIELVFSDRYLDVVPLLLPLLAAQTIRGVTTVYNVFLSAHGRGTELRNAGLVLTVSNLTLNFALIPPFGAMGAAIASLIALTVNLAAHVAFYRRAVRDTA